MNEAGRLDGCDEAALDASSTDATVAAELDEQAAPPVEVPERFVIDDAAKASWVVRKIVEARQYAKRVQAWCDGELRRAEREELWLLHRFGGELEAWLRAELQRRGGRSRSVKLPGGTAGLRLQPARLEVVDETTLAAWCRAHLPVALKVTVEANDRRGLELVRWHMRSATESRMRQHVLREPLNRHHDETGEVPSGADVRPAADQFYVR